MVIIIRNDEAEMFYTTSQWTDAQNMQHGGGIGYTVADSVMNSHTILGITSETDPVTGISSEAIAPMTHSEVAALAIGSSFSIAS